MITTPAHQFFLREDIDLPSAEAFQKAASRAEAAGLPATDENKRAMLQEYREHVHSAVMGDLTKLASLVNDSDFLQGFAERCHSSGLTEKQALTLSEGLIKAAALSTQPDLIRGFGDIVVQ